MTKKDLVLQRLEEIAEKVSKSNEVLALLALGSVGCERSRLDDYSDIDFFLIVENGCANQWIDDPSWLKEISPTAFYFKNTSDGYKWLYEDGVFCEFAIFDRDKLKEIPFSPGKVMFKRADYPATELEPTSAKKPYRVQDVHWGICEALTCVYVGLHRCLRGEWLSGTRFIQSYAVDLLVATAHHFYLDRQVMQDVFNNDRRFEQRFPDMVYPMKQMIQGYSRNGESALAILDFIDKHYAVNQYLKKEILQLASKVKENSRFNVEDK